MLIALTQWPGTHRARAAGAACEHPGMKQIAKFAIGLAVLVGAAVALNARFGAEFTDPSPAAKQLRDRSEAVAKTAGVPIERRACSMPRQFVPQGPVFYECPIAEAQIEALRAALPTHGWQAAPAGGDAGVAFLNNGLRARLFCTAPGQGCKFRIETSGKPAAP